MIQFQNPPPDGRGRGGRAANAAVAEALRARPEEWALCYTGRASGYGATINGGYIKAFPKGEFEATVRKTKDGKHDIYIRYIGGAP